MADTTYQPKVYHKRPGDEMVVADDGQVTVEDGGELEIESGGVVQIQSGGILELQSGFQFYLGSSSYTAGLTDLINSIYAQNNVVVHQAASASVAAGALAVSYIRNNVRWHYVLAGSNAVSATLWLVSAPSVGMELFIHVGWPTASGTNLGQSTLIHISCDAGVIMTPVTHLSNSRMQLMASAASVGKVHLVCFVAGEWSVNSINSATAVAFA
jgi:hypothetical protein